MLRRRLRLRRTDDVRRVFREGRSWVHPLLVLVALPNDLGFGRVGVTASRRVGGAVRRNRAKRLLREAARRLYDEFGNGSWDVMLVARAGILQAKEQQVERALASLLERAGLRSGPTDESDFVRLDPPLPDDSLTGASPNLPL